MKKKEREREKCKKKCVSFDKLKDIEFILYSTIIREVEIYQWYTLVK